MSSQPSAEGQPPQDKSSGKRFGCACLGIALVGLEVVGIGIAVLLFAGWYLGPDHLPNPARGIADRVTAAHLPYVEEVHFTPNPIYPADSVAIYLTADVTDAQVVDLYCRIITPDAAEHVVGPGSFSMTKGVHWIAPSPSSADHERNGSTGGTTVDPPTCP